MKPKNVGLMFFSMEPDKFFPYTQIDVVQFPEGLGGNDIIENDRIEIVSFPGPDRSVTIEGLKNFRVSNRRYRNRRIGDFLKELHLTEGRNTGFKKILDALEVNGSPKPEFETDDDRSYFVTRFFIHEGFAKEEEKTEDTKNSKMEDVSEDKSNNETSFETSLKQVLKQSDYDKLKPVIAKLAEVEEISIQEVMKLTNKSRTTAWRYMQILVECGAVESIGNTNNTTYKRV